MILKRWSTEKVDRFDNMSERDPNKMYLSSFSLALYKRRDKVAPSLMVKHDRADVKLVPWAKVTLGDMTMST